MSFANIVQFEENKKLYFCILRFFLELTQNPRVEDLSLNVVIFKNGCVLFLLTFGLFYSVCHSVDSLSMYCFPRTYQIDFFSDFFF